MHAHRCRFVTYDAFGNKQGEARYYNGMRNGLETHYHKNGNKSREITFKNNIKHGKYTEYNEQGQPVAGSEYVDGEVMAKTRYVDGKAVETVDRRTQGQRK